MDSKKLEKLDRFLKKARDGEFISPPKPISPVEQRTFDPREKTRSIPSYKPANWREWRHTPEVKVWQACALSLGIDPHSMTKSQHGWMAGNGLGPIFNVESFPDVSAREEFELRERLLLANLTNCHYFTNGSLTEEAPGNNTVRLDEFANWAVINMEWDGLPSEMVSMASVPEAKDENHNAVLPDPTPKLTVKMPEPPQKENREALDITTTRGCRRRILENWDTIEARYGPKADGRQVLRVLNEDKDEKKPALKTVQNHLIELRRKKLIP